MIFRRKFKITNITTAIGGDLVFIFGLGNDNRVYQWDARQVKWNLQQIQEQPNAS